MSAEQAANATPTLQGWRIADAAGAGRFVEATCDRERVCCCICPVAHPPLKDVCLGFIPAGERAVLARLDGHYSARCTPCAQAAGHVAPAGAVGEPSA